MYTQKFHKETKQQKSVLTQDRTKSGDYFFIFTIGIHLISEKMENLLDTRFKPQIRSTHKFSVHLWEVQKELGNLSFVSKYVFFIGITSQCSQISFQWTLPWGLSNEIFLEVHGELIPNVFPMIFSLRSSHWTDLENSVDSRLTQSPIQRICPMKYLWYYLLGVFNFIFNDIWYYDTRRWIIPKTIIAFDS